MKNSILIFLLVGVKSYQKREDEFWLVKSRTVTVQK